MLYALVFLILIIAIVLIWLVRVTIAANQRRQSRKQSSSSLPSHMQDISHRPTLAETAEDVVDRVGRGSRARLPQHESVYQSRYSGNRTGAVNRVTSDNASVTSLPAYGAASLPVPPAAVYDPTNVRPGGPTGVIPPSYADIAPPKYSATTTRPEVIV